METAIRLNGINKTFGKTHAVRDLNLEIPRGGVYGFIGPNGAGKTTAIRMIMSIIFPDSGELSVLGYDTALKAKDRIGYLPEERGVYRKMRVGAFLAYMARLKGVEGNLHQVARSALGRIQLEHTERSRCDELSKGMLQKVQFIAAVIHRPDLLILDEPFSGLDPVSMRLLRGLILEEHDRGATILFSTHVMPQAEEICEHVVMIHQGRKVLDAPLDRIRNQYDPRTIELDPLDRASDLSALREIAGIEQVTRTAGGHELRLSEGTNPAATMRRILELIPATRIELARPRLEDVFIQIVSGGSASTEEEEGLRAQMREEATA